MKLTRMFSGTSSVAFMMADAGGAGGTTETEGNISVETGFLSLAALAGADTDAIQTLTSRVPPAGIWRVRGKSVKMTQSEPKGDKPPLFRISYQYEVMGGKATDPNFDSDKMVGRTLTESYTIFPNDIETGIGLLKGRHQKAGLPNSGMPLGGVEGMEPGWLDTMVAAEFDLKIRTYIRNGETQAAFDWAAPVAEEGGDDE